MSEDGSGIQSNSDSDERKPQLKEAVAEPAPKLVVKESIKIDEDNRTPPAGDHSLQDKGSLPATTYADTGTTYAVVSASTEGDTTSSLESYVQARKATRAFSFLDVVDDRSAQDLLAAAKADHKEHAFKKVLLEREFPRVNRDLFVFVAMIGLSYVYTLGGAPGGYLLILSAMLFLWLSWVGSIGRLLTVSSLVFEDRSLRAIGPVASALALPFCAVSCICLVVLSRLTNMHAGLTLGLLSVASFGFWIHQVVWPVKLAAIAKGELDAHYGKPQSKWIVYMAPIAMYAPFIGMFLGVFLAAVSFSVAMMTGDASLYAVGPMVFYGSLLGMYSGFWYLKRLVNKAFEATGGTKRASLALDKTDQGLRIAYRPASSWERWVRQRMQHRGGKKLVYLLVMMLLVVTFQVPQMVLEAIVAWSAGGLTQGAADAAGVVDRSAALNQTLIALNLLELFILGLAAGAFGAYVAKPTNIRLTKSGMQILWRHGWLKYDDKLVRWDSLKRISVGLPPGKTEASDQELVIQTTDGRTLNLKLSAIPSVDDRERLLKAIESWAPEVERDARVLQVLEPPADHSYTELWMQALTAPPKRERFKPLVEGALLNEGQFQILGQLGVGGQGTAYLARNVISNEKVVLKEFILPVYVTVSVRRQALERFENEARILKHLDHTQIVKLVDFFVEDHRSYLVLEHIDGQSLRQIVESRGAMPENQVMALAEQMCTILDYLHGLIPPVVHRDFTPDNLILRADGVLKLVDFNVAQQSEATTTGTVVGKHSYLPPEQFRGEPIPQSDIYAMGATMHFLLTGENPEPISVSRPATVCDTVSGGMNLLVATATAMTPEARFKSAAEMQAQIDMLQGKIPLLGQGEPLDTASETQAEATEEPDTASSASRTL
jgi:Serine/threonine protein kinase